MSKKAAAPNRRRRTRRRRTRRWHWWTSAWAKLAARVMAFMSVLIAMLMLNSTRFDSGEVRVSLGMTAVYLFREIVGVKTHRG